MLLVNDYTPGIWDTLWPFIFTIIVSILLYVFKNTIKETPLGKWLPILFLGLLIVYEIHYFETIVLLFFRDIQLTMENLPLHLCGSSAVLIMLYLAFKKEILLDILILQSIIGAIVTFIFPDISYAPFTYRYIQFFMSHILFFVVPIYYMIIEDYRVSKKNLKYGLIFIHILAIPAITVNLLFDTHYMYILPDNTQNLFAFLPLHEVIPFLGKWPAVLLFGEVLAITVYFAIYFLLKKLQTIFD